MTFTICGFVGGRQVSARTMLSDKQMDDFVTSKIAAGRYTHEQGVLILERLCDMEVGDEEWFATGEPLPLEADSTRPFVHVVRIAI